MSQASAKIILTEEEGELNTIQIIERYNEQIGIE